MNKYKVNKEIYDNYVDATVALFMEYYSSSLTENIRTEAEEIKDVEFPESLDKRCQALIKKEHSRQLRRCFWNTTVKSLRFAAIFAIAALSLSSFLFLTVEAIRVPIINYYIEQGHEYWEIGIQDEDATSENTGDIDIKDPLSGIIPTSYSLVIQEGDSLGEITALYKNTEGDRILLSAKEDNNTFKLDVENADTAKECKILGYRSIIVEENENIRVAWIDKEASTIFCIIADNMYEEEIIDIVERFIQKSAN